MDNELEELKQKLKTQEETITTLSNKIKDGDARRDELEKELEGLRKKTPKVDNFLGGFEWDK